MKLFVLFFQSLCLVLFCNDSALVEGKMYWKCCAIIIGLQTYFSLLPSMSWSQSLPNFLSLLFMLIYSPHPVLIPSRPVPVEMSGFLVLSLRLLLLPFRMLPLFASQMRCSKRNVCMFAMLLSKKRGSDLYIRIRIRTRIRTRTFVWRFNHQFLSIQP